MLLVFRWQYSGKAKYWTHTSVNISMTFHHIILVALNFPSLFSATNISACVDINIYWALSLLKSFLLFIAVLNSLRLYVHVHLWPSISNKNFKHLKYFFLRCNRTKYFSVHQPVHAFIQLANQEAHCNAYVDKHADRCQELQFLSNIFQFISNIRIRN